MTHNGLINRAAIKSVLRAEGYRTSKEFLDVLEARVSLMIKQGIRGMGGLGRKTVNAAALERGRYRVDVTEGQG